MGYITKILAVILLLSGLIGIWYVGFVHHKFPIGVLLLPLAWYWWTYE